MAKVNGFNSRYTRFSADKCVFLHDSDRLLRAGARFCTTLHDFSRDYGVLSRDYGVKDRRSDTARFSVYFLASNTSAPIPRGRNRQWQSSLCFEFFQFIFWICLGFRV